MWEGVITFRSMTGKCERCWKGKSIDGDVMLMEEVEKSLGRCDSCQDV